MLRSIAVWCWLLLIAIRPAFATVHINEIMPNPEGDDNKEGAGKEWVELYNDADETVNLAGWKLIDLAGNEKTLDSLGEIGKKSYKVYEVEAIQGWMNNSSGDTLWLKNASGEQHGKEFNYGSDPGEGVTLGRWPDGADGWATMKSATKGSANSGPEPTATPTPKNTPTPTITPTPEVTPTPTKAPSPTMKPPTATPRVDLNENGNSDGEPSISELRDQVLGEQTKEDGGDESDSSEIRNESGVDWLMLLLIGGGAVMLGGAGVVYWRSRTKADDF